MIIVLFSTLYEMSILHVLSTTSCVSACVFRLSCLLILHNIGFGESLDGTYLASGYMSCQRHSPKATCPKYPVNLEIIQRTGGQANLLVMASYLKSNKQQVLSSAHVSRKAKRIWWLSSTSCFEVYASRCRTPEPCVVLFLCLKMPVTCPCCLH